MIPMPTSKPSPPIPAEPAIVAMSRVVNYANRLFDALEQLHEAGGSTRAAAFQGWTPKTHARMVASLKATRDALAAELQKLEGRVRHFPRRRTG